MSVKNILLSAGFAVIAGGSAIALATPASAFAQPVNSVADCSVNILTFPTWFNGLVDVKTNAKGEKECVIKSPDDLNTPGQNDGLSKFIWHIVLNVIDIALQLVGYIAVGFILYGGFAMITSNGSPEGVAKARQSILNAVIGLAISISAVVIVNLIMGIIK